MGRTSAPRVSTRGVDEDLPVTTLGDVRVSFPGTRAW